MSAVDTYRVVRRQDMGGGRFREHGELMPEAHLFFAPDHWLHTGEVEQARDVPEAEFRSAVQKYCPDQAEQVYAAVGLLPGVMVEDGGTVRAAPMLPSRLPALANTKTVKLPPKTLQHSGVMRQQEVTIRATDAPPGAPTPGVESPLLPEEIIVEPSEGAKHHYEDAGSVDPAALNEALTSTRPSDIKEHDTKAAYKKPEAVVKGTDPVTGVAESPPQKESDRSTAAKSEHGEHGPSKATPAKATPAKAAPAKSQPSKSTPAGGKPKS